MKPALVLNAILTSISHGQTAVADQKDICELSGVEAQKPALSLEFCFRNNINACCQTAHSDIMGSAFSSYMPSGCQSGSMPHLEEYSCFGCHYT